MASMNEHVLITITDGIINLIYEDYPFSPTRLPSRCYGTERLQIRKTRFSAPFVA